MPLRIGSQLIERLSGPTMGQMLYPNQSGWPVLLLFGDQHNSMRQLCTRCECKGPNDPHCCLEIFSSSFLMLLDEAAAKQPISFYTEFFEPKKEKQMFHSQPKQFTQLLQSRLASPPKGVMQLLREHLIACYFRDSKHPDTISDRFCPTQNIQWEYGDLRQRGTSLSLTDLVTKEPYFYEPLLFRVLYSVYEYLEAVQDASSASLDEYIDCLQISKRLGPIKSREFWHSLHLLLSSPTEYVKWFMSDHALVSHSTLRNVHPSSKVESLISRSLLIELMYYSHQGKDFDKSTKEWSIFFKRLSQEDWMSPPHSIPHDPIILIDVTLPFLDLYFLFHSYAKNSKGLSIGYFGSTHVKGMINLLVNELGLYRLSEKKETKSVRDAPKIRGTPGQQRCIVMDESVDWSI